MHELVFVVLRWTKKCLERDQLEGKNYDEP